MMKAGWSARQVDRELGHSDCVVRKCWDQWIREMSFTRKPGSGRTRQTVVENKTSFQRYVEEDDIQLHLEHVLHNREIQCKP
ncbi:hypothetical protein TNCV_3965101 [Trichonephila clavipes]|nr:hypothetical protein TNCV_3965101 [Trichonephila clavipes]